MNCNCGNNISQDDLRLVRGNDFGIIYPIRPKYPDGSTVEDFDLNACTDLSILIRRDGGSAKDVMTCAESYVISGVKELTVRYDGLKMRLGSYRLDISGKFGGKDWRSYSRDEGFGIVESNEEANIPVGSFIADGVYTVICDFLMTYQTQEQADWEESDTSLPSYIKNKPNIPTALADLQEDSTHRVMTDAEKTKLEGLSNYDDTEIRGLISDTNANFANYYTKTQTYSQSEVDTLMRTQRQGRYMVASSLPPASEDTMFAIYLVPSADSEAGNTKDEYVTLQEESSFFWEKIGSTSVDMSNYPTTSDMTTAINAAVAGLYSKPSGGIPKTDLDSSVQTSLGKADTALQSETDPVFASSPAYGITAADIARWDAGGSGEENVIETVKVNGTALIPDANKAVDVTVPTKVSDLTNDSGFISTESDPTVPSWAKASSKPSYTASEVGAVPTTRTVNGKALSADITLSASDVGALPSSTVIPDAQIQSDWNQTTTTAKDYIKNKPTIPAAQVQANWNETSTSSKAYIQNKPTIPAAQVNSDWSASSGVAQILNKPTIPFALSQLTDDTTHRVVTDTEKAAWNGKADKTPVVNHGTSDTTFALTPNIMHIWGTVASLNLTLATPADASIVNQYTFEFTSGSTPTTISLPQGILWPKGNPLASPEANMIYEINIRNNKATWSSWEVTA